MPLHPVLLPVLAALAAFSYAFVGHAGASAYLSLGLLAGLAPAAAKGQALLLNLAVAGFSAFFFTRAAAPRWRLLAWLLAGSVPASFLSAAWVPSLPAFRLLVALGLAAASLRLLLPAPAQAPAPLPGAPRLLLLGAGLGLLAGLSGVGGGIYLSPVLLLSGWAGTRETAALAAWFILLNSLAGLGGLLAHGHVPAAHPAWFLPALGAGALGAWWGSRAEAPSQRRALAGVSALAALKLLF